MLLSAKNVPRNSEGSRGDMYGEACCESWPVTHLVQLWRIILLPDFIPDRFLDLSPPTILNLLTGQYRRTASTPQKTGSSHLIS